MNEWIDELADLSAAGERAVVVTVAAIRGSAPREVGAKMLVTSGETLGTIGGGQLEYQCSRLAFEMLGDDEQARLRKFPLGSSMGQCCGGVVDILFEPVASILPTWLQDLRALHGQREPAIIATRLGEAGDKSIITADSVFAAADMDADILTTARQCLAAGQVSEQPDNWFLEIVVGSDLNIAVFGAGHVGSAVVQALSALDCNIRWIDSRRNLFRKTPTNVRSVEAADPALEVAAMPAGSCFLVMTHSHAIDFEVCDRILRRNDYLYCGLIGSLSKRRRFEKRFRAQGMPDTALEKLVCPIGVAGINGKKPAEIAVAASAEVLQAYEKVRQGTDLAYPDNVHLLNKKN
ncbi:MAG: xanthine dehydrogenase accessory protein XdhC [Woeseiaceae bacterium]